MNYVGKLFSNFKDMYSGINSATLTGAIDVIVVQQEDGSFTCSPFHVRFGKLGVLRAREKVVDIEINGVTVDLKMKLGDGGTAYFVQEADALSEIPGYLATSPIEESGKYLNNDFLAQQKKVVNESMRMRTVSVPALSLLEHDRSQIASRKRSDVSIQTDMTGLDVESRNKISVTSDTVTNDVVPKANESSSVTRGGRRVRRVKRRSKPDSAAGASGASEDVGNKAAAGVPEEGLFDMELSDDDNEGAAAAAVSAPAPVSLTPWRTGLELHPFSDGDISPVQSPMTSRPPSPKSDSECERQKLDGVAQTQLSGDQLLNLEGIQWNWGQLPQPVQVQKTRSRIPSINDGQKPTGSSGGLFQFMRGSKTTGEQEGMYLDDLQADKEVAALHLYSQGAVSPSKTVVKSDDDDVESGRGGSLCQSPDAQHSLDTDRHLATLSGLPDVTLSLCGPLRDGIQISSDQFAKHVVTFKAFCDNPSILNDAKLVVKLYNSYYTWQMAAPLLMSFVAFRQPLPESTVESITKPQAAKKEGSRRKGWYSWWGGGAAAPAGKPPADLAQRKSSDSAGKPAGSVKQQASEPSTTMVSTGTGTSGEYTLMSSTSPTKSNTLSSNSPAKTSCTADTSINVQDAILPLSLHVEVLGTHDQRVNALTSSIVGTTHNLSLASEQQPHTQSVLVDNRHGYEVVNMESENAAGQINTSVESETITVLVTEDKQELQVSQLADQNQTVVAERSLEIMNKECHVNLGQTDINLSQSVPIYAQSTTFLEHKQENGGVVTGTDIASVTYTTQNTVVTVSVNNGEVETGVHEAEVVGKVQVVGVVDTHATLVTETVPLPATLGAVDLPVDTPADTVVSLVGPPPPPLLALPFSSPLAVTPAASDNTVVCVEQSSAVHHVSTIVSGGEVDTAIHAEAVKKVTAWNATQSAGGTTESSYLYSSTNAAAVEFSNGQPTSKMQVQEEATSVFSDSEMELTPSEARTDKYVKSLKLTSDQLASLNLCCVQSKCVLQAMLNLREGINEAVFSVTTQYQGTSSCSAYIYLWHWHDSIIVSDIDGTITRSDVFGQVLPMIGKDWSQVGIASLYSMIHNNGYKFMYLSARAIGQSRVTRDYLRSVQQGDFRLPDGPLFLAPSSLIHAFHKEVIERKPEEFKIKCLRDIKALFPDHLQPLYAGFGNRVNDVWAYTTVGIPSSRIFTVNPRGQLYLEVSQVFRSSWSHFSDIVDHFFPPVNHARKRQEKHSVKSEFTPFNYWKPALPEIVDDISEPVLPIKNK